MEPTALVVAIAVLPVFGVGMFAVRRYLAWTSRLGYRIGTAGAAGFYALVVVGAVALVAGLGRLPAAALAGADPVPWRVAAGVALVAPAAVMPYLVELAMSSWLQGRRRLPATGLDGAKESVAAVSRQPRGYAVLAVATAVAEELLFRGAVLYEVTAARGAVLGVLAASVVFGLHHAPFGVPALVGKAVAGGLWALLMLLTGLIVVPILAHLLFQHLVWRRTARLERVGEVSTV